MAARQKKPNPIDDLLRKLTSLPPTIDLLIAGSAAVYALVAIFVDNQRVVGLGAMLIALLFAVFGIISLSREMKLSKVVAQCSLSETLMNMQNKQFESYVITLFNLAGYNVRLAIDEIHRADDADLIAERKKEIVLIQYNHFDDDGLDMRSVQSLFKAGAALRATQCIAITFGRIAPEVANWSARKGIRILGMKEVLEYAETLTGSSSPQELSTPPEVVAEIAHEVTDIQNSTRRYLFVDFDGIAGGLSQLTDLLEHHPAYELVASKLPEGSSLDELRAKLTSCSDRIHGFLGDQTTTGRYFQIQHYLANTKEGKQATWLALDAEPRQFPEGCSELVAINKAFGFDHSASQRLIEAMLLVDRREGKRIPA